MVKEKVPDEIMNQLANWRKQAVRLRIIHVVMGLIAIISSITVASRVLQSAETISWFAWVAAITAGILTSLGLETKSNNMRSAWRILNDDI